MDSKTEISNKLQSYFRICEESSLVPQKEQDSHDKLLLEVNSLNSDISFFLITKGVHCGQDREGDEEGTAEVV